MVLKPRTQFRFDLVLFLFFVGTIVLAMMIEGETDTGSHHEDMSLLLHPWFGLAVLVGGVIHLALHWKWLKVTLRRFSQLKGQSRQFFLIDVLLLVMFVAVNVSGIVMWRTDQRGVWLSLHALSSTFMLLIILFHLVKHWKWIKLNARLGTRTSRARVS